MGELSKHEWNRKQQSGQSILIWLKNIGVKVYGGNKPKHNTHVCDKGIDNALLFDDTQVIFNYSFN